MDPRVQEAALRDREAGQKAKGLLTELAPYMDALDARLLKVWREDAKTPEVREETWHRMKALDMLRAELRQLIESGDFAEKRLSKS